MTVTILIALAGLMGAGGVILAAAAAHMAPGAGLDSAAYMLLFHAVAVLGGAALVQQGVLWRPLALIVLAAWVLGAVLFADHQRAPQPRDLLRIGPDPFRGPRDVVRHAVFLQ